MDGTQIHERRTEQKKSLSWTQFHTAQRSYFCNQACLPIIIVITQEGKGN